MFVTWKIRREFFLKYFIHTSSRRTLTAKLALATLHIVQSLIQGKSWITLKGEGNKSISKLKRNIFYFIQYFKDKMIFCLLTRQDKHLPTFTASPNFPLFLPLPPPPTRLILARAISSPGSWDSGNFIKVWQLWRFAQLWFRKPTTALVSIQFNPHKDIPTIPPSSDVKLMAVVITKVIFILNLCVTIH